MTYLETELITYAELDRMFFESLRLAVVAAGYIPDQTIYGSASEYETAKTVLRNTPKQLIEVFGAANEDARDAKSINKIVIDRKNKEKGTIGGNPATYFVVKNPSLNTFTKKRYPDTSSHIHYEVRIIGEFTSYDRIMCSIVDTVLGSKRFLQTVDGTGTFTENRVLVTFEGEITLPKFSFLERIFKFKVHDVFVEDSTILRDDIPKLSTICYNLYNEEVTDTNLLDHICIDILQLLGLALTDSRFLPPFDVEIQDIKIIDQQGHLTTYSLDQIFSGSNPIDDFVNYLNNTFVPDNNFLSTFVRTTEGIFYNNLQDKFQKLEVVAILQPYVLTFGVGAIAAEDQASSYTASALPNGSTLTHSTIALGKILFLYLDNQFSEPIPSKGYSHTDGSDTITFANGNFDRNIYILMKPLSA